LFSCLLSRNIKVKIHKTIILPVILYGSLTLREEHGLRVFENSVLRKIFVPKREARKMRWVGHVAHIGEERKV
jgi:hypothetical protein